MIQKSLGEACGFSEVTIPSASEDQSDQEPETKKIKLDDDNPIKEEVGVVFIVQFYSFRRNQQKYC